MKACWLAVVLAVAASSAAAEPLREIRVTNDRAPDCSSLEAIVASVTRGCKTDDEKVLALYNFCRYAYYHHAYPNEPGGISALKMINVYGWGLCGGQHTVLAALWDKAGYPWRYRGWSNPGHTTVEVFYGGRWHYLDTFLKFYAWRPDPGAPGGRTIAGQEDLRAQPSLVTEAFQFDQARKVWYEKDNRFEMRGDRANWTAPAFLVCGDDIPGLLSGIQSSNNAGSPRSWGGVTFDDPGYSTAVHLGPGYALTLDWDRVEGAWYFAGSKNPPHHTCGDKDYRNCPAIGPLIEPYRARDSERSWSNGTLMFKADFANETSLGNLQQVENVVWHRGELKPREPGKPASFVLAMESPYVVVRTSGKISGDAKIQLSTDGKTWKAADLSDLSKSVNGRYCYWVRVTFEKPVRSIELTSLVQHNQEALPYLAPGKNTITVGATNPAALGKNRLVVTYAYCPGSRSATPEEMLERDAEVARGHFASWAESPIVVQKVIEKLPATIEIPVPTPKGKQPVYPRMVFLRREVLAPGQEPMPVPARPRIPAVGPNETLATLPNPWTIGAQAAPAKPTRPTKTAVLPASKTAYVSKKGEVFEHSFIKWLKDNSDARVLLVGFDKQKLPDPKSLASAKLLLYVREAHDKAPMETAAVPLTKPFEPGSPLDFSALGKPTGSTIVAKGNGPGAVFDPPRRYEIDVTRQVRAWARGEPCHGLGVRIVPNRGVDDGWTVRFTPDKEKPAELEIAVYGDR